MKSPILKILLAIVIGELSLIIFTTVAQEVLFDGISYTDSSRFDLVFGGLATFLSAILAGIVIVLISGRGTLIPPFVISLIIVIETSWLINAQLSGDPVWFDILAGASLIVGVWIGFFCGYKVKTTLRFLNNPTKPQSPQR